MFQYTSSICTGHVRKQVINQVMNVNVCNSAVMLFSPSYLIMDVVGVGFSANVANLSSVSLLGPGVYKHKMQVPIVQKTIY